MTTPTLFRSIANCDRARQSCAASYVATLTTEAGRLPARSGFVTAAKLMEPNTNWSWESVQLIAWENMTQQGAGELRSRIAKEVAEGRMAPATASRCLGVVRGALRQAWLHGLMDADTLQRLNTGLANVVGSRPPVGRHVPPTELQRVFASLANDPTKQARRDAACLALGAVGLRRAEIAALDVEDLATTEEGAALRIRGKGHKVRVVHLTNGALSALRDHLMVRGSAPGPMFATNHRGHKKALRRVTAAGLRHVLNTRLAEAACPVFTWHDLRRTFAGNALDAGVDLPTVQAIMGHQSPTTTAKYDRRPESRRIAAMQTICVPYHPPH